MQVQFLGQEDPLEVGMATQSSILALRIPIDKGGWWATVHRVAKSWIQLKWLSTHIHTNSSFTHNEQVQAYLRDILDLVSDHCNKANIVMK